MPPKAQPAKPTQGGTAGVPPLAPTIGAAERDAEYKNIDFYEVWGPWTGLAGRTAN